MNDEPRDREPETVGTPVPPPASGSSRRRAYAFDGWTIMPSVRAIDRRAVFRASGLRSRPVLQFSIMERNVAKIDVTAYLLLTIVPAHATVRSKAHLRREGHDLG